ncbi:MAG: penicillin-binding transpeptidase domain-containing protein [Defluviitaleaceae bacterium]|nr:penicillin-binding transpeptidase domain-containing protein [Defluviitaleaceae bacterium]
MRRQGSNESELERRRKKKASLTNEKERGNKNKNRNIKLNFMGFLIVSSLAFLLVRIAYIQVVYGEEFTQRAISQRITNNSGSERIITPNRGTILDRNRNLQALAISTTVYDIFIDPYRILNAKNDTSIRAGSAGDPEEIYRRINNALGIPIEELRGIVLGNPNSQDRVIARHVDLTTKQRMMDEGAHHVHFRENTVRNYPGGVLAASLIGYIRGDSIWGLERGYNRELVGTPGRASSVFDDNNNPTTNITAAIEGYTLITTIDLAIQQEAQRLVTHYGGLVKAATAALIVADPNTGEILAMAEYPSFDLNDPLNVERINSERIRDRIMQEPEETWIDRMFEINRNFSVIDTYEPGSVFKPLVFAAALETGVISETDIFFCGGGRDINGTFIRCWFNGDHGPQNFAQALANSCNPAAMEVAHRLGRERYYNFQRDFGIGRPTGIDIPGEPNTERLVHSLSMLNPVELAAASIGQGFNVTSMQMLSSFSSVINGGNLMVPFVVSQVVDGNGNIVHENTPTISRKVISRETSDLMAAAMIDAVEWGTARRSAVPGYLIGGKTGTGEQGDKSDPDNNDVVETLINYFPANNPQFIIMAVISLPEIYELGNAQTLPMVRDMTNFIIANRQIEAHDREAFNRVLIDNTMYISDYVGRSIAEVTNSLNFFGFTYDISGNGDVVRAQFPSGSTRVDRGSVIHLTIGMSGDEVPLTTVPNVVGMSAEQAREIVRSVNLVPVMVDNLAGTQNTGSGDGAEEERSSVRVVASQLPSDEIRIQEWTEILIFVE